MGLTNLIVGLGNIGNKYINTRHNVGFSFLDLLADKYSCSYNYVNKIDGSVAKFSVNGVRVFLIKPHTFMNLSGSCLAKSISFYKLSVSNLLVVHDDIHLGCGKVKYKFAGSSGGHNGIKSIDASISNKYWRLRIGIGKPHYIGDLSTYVLSKFTSEDYVTLDYVYQICADLITNIIVNNHDGVYKQLSSL